MTIRVGSNLVIDGNRNVILGQSSLIPGTPTTGTVFFNENKRIVQGWNGSAWVDLTSSGSGNAWTWGFGSSGRLGNSSAANQSSPVSVLGGFTDWIQISPGYSHNVAIRDNGTALAWGSNFAGQLGNGFAVDRSSPVSVVGGFTDWAQISGGSFHSPAIRANGTAWCWGEGIFGEIGDNNTINRSSPVSVVGGFTDWIEISGGSSFTLARRTNGTIWSWGYGQYGRLGNIAITNRSSPVSVVGGFTDWTHISAGGQGAAAIRANGTAWCWGRNNWGQIGDSTVINKSSPVSVVGGFTDWIQIDAGQAHTMAIRSNGTSWGWGYNGQGNIGDGTTIYRSSPSSVVGAVTSWVQISAYNNSAAIRGST